MDGYGTQLLLVAVLVVLNAAFAGSEIALISLRESQLQRLERASRAGRVLARLARDPNRFMATIQIGITLAGFLASATAAVSLAKPLVPMLSPLGSAAGPVAIVLVTLVLTFVTLVFGELAPKRVAMQRAERWGLLVARPLDVLSTVSRPAVWSLSTATNVAVRLVGADPKADRDEISPDELRDIVADHGGFTDEQRQIISGAVQITERRLRQIMVPRLHVFTVEARASVGEASARLAASGHSRAPVVRDGQLDDPVGVVHLRDLVEGHCRGETVERCAAPVLRVVDSVTVSEALRQFKMEHQQLAVVVDEHGAVSGIVTLEDLLEELVGEIYDETDRDVRSARRQADGSLLLPGIFPVHDLPDVGVELLDPPEGDYITVAGLVLARLGHIPTRPGETADVGGWDADVMRVEGHAITKVRLRPRMGSADGTRVEAAAAPVGETLPSPAA